MNLLRYIAELVVDAFNKTALGIGVLVALYLLYTGYYLRGIAILVIGVPVYFWLYNRYGGISENGS